MEIAYRDPIDRGNLLYPMDVYHHQMKGAALAAPIASQTDEPIVQWASANTAAS